MAEEGGEGNATEDAAGAAVGSDEKRPDDKRAEVKRLPGNLTYIGNYGGIKKVLDKAINASTPDRLTQDYLGNVFGFTGGPERSALGVLRRVGLIAADGSPTELYSKFRSESGRPEAVYIALRNGFAEMFKRSETIYAANDAKLTDLIVEITGLTKEAPTVKAIRGTFKALSSYLPQGFSPASLQEGPQRNLERDGEDPPPPRAPAEQTLFRAPETPLGLSYQINIVLPETRDIEVLNAIFRSLRDNLLR